MFEPDERLLRVRHRFDGPAAPVVLRHAMEKVGVYRAHQLVGNLLGSDELRDQPPDGDWLWNAGQLDDRLACHRHIGGDERLAHGFVPNAVRPNRGAFNGEHHELDPE